MRYKYFSAVVIVAFFAFGLYLEFQAPGNEIPKAPSGEAQSLADSRP